MDAEKVLEILVKLDKLLAFAQHGARMLDAQKALMEREFPDLLPPDLPESIEDLLNDTEGIEAEICAEGEGEDAR